MKLRLINKKLEAKGVKTFVWEPEHAIDWKAGQYYYYTLPKLNYPDPRGATRHFTISSSPTEGPTLRLTTKIREESGFKKTLDELKIGAKVEGDGPSGTFIMDELEKGSHIFIAGGIGITPFRSMIKYAMDAKLPSKICLIYSNSTAEEIAFRHELETWVKAWPNLSLAMTITKPEESEERWKGLTGRIDERMIKNVSGNLENPTYWLCGPPAMIDAMEKVVGKMGITADRLRSEKFTGY